MITISSSTGKFNKVCDFMHFNGQDYNRKEKEEVIQSYTNDPIFASLSTTRPAQSEG